MIETFIDSALIIDDKPAEVENLKKELDKRQILHIHLLPAEMSKKPFVLKNRKIIFLDLYVDDTLRNVTEQISLIRKLFKDCVGKEFGTYGIVLWTKHAEEIAEFTKKIHNDKNDYRLPLFIVSLDKTKYFKEGFDNLIPDLDKILKENIASSFFIDWYNGVDTARDNAINNIYSLCGDYQKQSNNLKYILFLLAKNHTGIHFDDISKNGYPLHTDSFNAFNNILEYELNNIRHETENFLSDLGAIKYFGADAQIQDLSRTVKGDLFHKDVQVVRESEKYFANGTPVSTAFVIRLDNEMNSIKAAINTRMHFDFVNLNKDVIVPGNVYEVLDKNNSVYLNEDYVPTTSIRIIAEVSPPCDYAQKQRVKLRFVSGAICDLSGEFLRKINRKENLYWEMYPIQLTDSGPLKILIFDFRHLSTLDDDTIKDEKTFKLIFRAKDRFFADLFQKLSSYSARLGLAIIH